MNAAGDLHYFWLSVYFPSKAAGLGSFPADLPLAGSQFTGNSLTLAAYNITLASFCRQKYCASRHSKGLDSLLLTAA